MPFIASAERLIDAAPSECFAHFVDFASWKAWMPASFRPLFGPGVPAGPSRPLEVGDRVAVRIAGVPAPVLIKIVRLAPGREIAWRGGVRSLLTGEHAFLFEDAGGGRTRARSEEIWDGALASVGALERAVRPLASQIGAEQLDGFARWLASGRR